MIKALIITCVCGFILAAGSFGVLSVVGIPHPHFSEWDWHDDDAHPSGPKETKMLNWAGGPELGLAIPAEVTYRQAPQVSMVIHAPHDMLQAIRLDGNTLRFDDPDRFRHRGFHQAITVEISAPAVSRFDVSSAVRLHLKDIDLDTLSLGVSGAADVDVTGKAHKLDFSGSGASNLDADALVVEDAAISLSGAGRVSAGPTGTVGVNIAGLGMVSLLHQPKTLSKAIAGLGMVSVGDGKGGSATTAGIGGMTVNGHDHHHDHDDGDDESGDSDQKSDSF